jgi:hypothetical protein
VCFIAFIAFKGATVFFWDGLAPLNVLCSEVYNRQFPHPPSRTTSFSGLVLSVSDEVQNGFGPLERALGDAGVFGFFLNLAGRKRTAAENVLQKLHSLAASISVFFVSGSGEKVFS